ncbi:MAG: quinol:cytochrome C oxidoreductase [Schlesneria sp.]
MSTATSELASQLKQPSMTLKDQNLPVLGRRVSQAAAVFGVLNLIIALFVDIKTHDGMRHFWHSYLLAICFWTSLSLGALFFISIQFLTRAGWSVVLRRIAEIFAASIIVNALTFVPILVGLMLGQSSLYIWNDPTLAATDELIRNKTPYLNASFFVIRSILYFTAWSYLARKFWRASFQQDVDGDSETTLRLERLSAPTLLVSAFTVTFASIDWIVSLDPHWFSSIFGIYFFSASIVGFLAALILSVDILQRRMGLLSMVTETHRHDLGKLLFGFNCFWAYIAFSQYLLIWYANIPEETAWFKARQSGGWATVSLLLIAGHFVLPFLGLMPRRMKEIPQVLAFWSLVLVIMHAVDLYWLIFPTLDPSGPQAFLQPVLCLIGIGGIYSAGWLLIAGNNSLIPLGDPRLRESLRDVH